MLHQGHICDTTFTSHFCLVKRFVILHAMTYWLPRTCLCVHMKLVIWSNLEVQLLSLHVTLEFIYFCFMSACSYHVYFCVMSACSYHVYFFVMSVCSSQVYLHKMQLDEWVGFYLTGWELLPSVSRGCHVKELEEEDLLETKGACVITAGLQSLDIWWNWCPQKEMVVSRSLNCFAAGSWP
jgi:hypothetical protein